MKAGIQRRVKMVRHLTKKEFLKEIFNYKQNKTWQFQGDLPCVIDFYADWCGPCKIVAPIMEELSEYYEGKVNFYKINTETELELASIFGITGIPSILFCPKDGQPQMSVGAYPKEQLKQLVDVQLLGQGDDMNIKGVK